MGSVPERFFELQKLATGGFATIYKAVDTETGRIVALKDTAYNIQSRSATRAMRREVAILRHIDHEHIVKCVHIECKPGEPRYFIAMELCDSDLHDLIRGYRHRKKRVPEAMVLQMLRDMADALTYLHNPINFTTVDSLTDDGESVRVIIHRDIKPGNVMLCGKTFKLGDFNLAREIAVDVGAASNTGTISYMAPELLNGQRYDEKVDIWGLGCTAHEMCTYYSPFSGQSMAQALQAILTGRYEPIGNSYSSDLRDLIRSMLSIEPTKRPTAAEILAHPLLAAYGGREKKASTRVESSDPRESRDAREAREARHARETAELQHAREEREREREKEIRKLVELRAQERELARRAEQNPPAQAPATPGSNVLDYVARTPGKRVGASGKSPGRGGIETPLLRQSQGIATADQRLTMTNTIQAAVNALEPGSQTVGTAAEEGKRGSKMGAESAEPGQSDQHASPMKRVLSAGSHQPTTPTTTTRRTHEQGLRRNTTFAGTREYIVTNDASPLIAAVNQNNVKMASSFLQFARQYGSTGMTALHTAALNNYSDVVALLAPKEGRMRMNRAYKFGTMRYSGLTALHLAALNGHADSVGVLASIESQLTEKTTGYTALIICAVYGSVECARKLITYEKGCQDKKGMTALMHAVHGGNLEMIKILSHHESSIEDADGKTALAHAANTANLEIIRMLLPLYNKHDILRAIELTRQYSPLPTKKLDEVEKYMMRYV
ncbi:Kinase, NEK [Giardia muris]|uniref:non-specific serine/threonine protein kinase n=1 Tax=Giardia muris TaxID=5742 RepID=A0A4Z1SVM8_GIAMU|nr:Kinase, NEK [Giardia muris]|eukprot:TNJ28965.1 Kinase, NEK [Giardia muris]